MTDMTARLRLEGNASGLVAAAAQGERALAGVRAAGRETGDALGRTGLGAATASRELTQTASAGERAGVGLHAGARGAEAMDRSARGLHSALGLAGGALAAIGLKSFATESKDAAFEWQGLKTGLEVATGSAARARGELGYVREQATRLGIPLRDAAQSYSQLTLATMGTASAGKTTHAVWEGVAMAGAALNRTTDQQKLAMLALSQMASKGVISMEDLRGQLAEALPGAMATSARAMGMTSGAFMKLVGDGDLLADVFLPKLAAQLQKDYGPALERSLNSPLGKARKALAETSTGFYELRVAAGEGLLVGATEGLKAFNAELGNGNAQQAARELGSGLGQGLAAVAGAAAFASRHLHELQGAAAAVVTVGIGRWLIGAATEARNAAAAYIAKGAAATASGAQGVTAASAEQRAVNTLRGAVEAAARAELQAAQAANMDAAAKVRATEASLALARAQLANSSSALTYAQRVAAVAAAERELAAAKSAGAIASARAESAAAGLGRATTVMGGAMGVARGAAGGLVSLLGGPWGVALLAGAALVGVVTTKLREDAEATASATEAQRSFTGAMADAKDVLKEAGDYAKAWGLETAAAKSPTDQLSASTGLLAEQTFRLADARRQAAVAGLQESAVKLRSQLAEYKTTSTKPPTMMERLAGLALVEADLPAAMDLMAGRNRTVKAPIASGRNGPVIGDVPVATAITGIERQLNENMRAQMAITLAPPSKAKPVAPSAAVTDDKKKKKEADPLARGDRSLENLRELTQAELRLRDAMALGGVALDEWKIADAGRQAVAAAGLNQEGKLKAGQESQAAAVRSAAEGLERLKLANERVGKAKELARSADDDARALREEAAAAALGERALEAYRIKQAGVQALHAIGIITLDQLSTADRKVAQSAVAAAEGKERQAIATDKANKVAGALQDLDRRIAAEQRQLAAVTSGTKAEVEYAKAEFIRGEVERAGTNITLDQVAAIQAKAAALYDLQSQSERAGDNRSVAEELHLAGLTNRERGIEQRALDLKTAILKQHVELTNEEALARGRIQATREADLKATAEQTAQLKENLRQTFIDTGHLGFDQVAEYAEKRLRQAVYDALLAKPIDMVINAVVNPIMNNVSAKLFGGGGSGGGNSLNTALADIGIGGGGSGGSLGSLSSLFGGGGGGSGAMASMASSAAFVYAAYEATKMVTSSLGGLFGFDKQQQANADKAAKFGGGVVINLAAGFLGGKQSNEAAVASLDAGGQITSMGGAKRTEETTAKATQIAEAVAAFQEGLRDAGATLNATVSSIDIGVRDTTHIMLTNGVKLETAVGDVAAAVKGATQAIVDGAQFATEAQRAYAQQLLASGGSLEELAAKLSAAKTITGQLDDAILQFTDVAAYNKKMAMDAIEESYAALKAQADELIAAGLVSADVLAKIDRLKALQVDDALKKLAGAAGQATDALGALDRARPDLQTWLDRSALGDASPANASEQRGLAYAQYERQLELARRGDADAIGGLTDYADRLLAADREATASASERRGLYEKVTSDVSGLGGLKAPLDPVVTAMNAVATGNALLVDTMVSGSLVVDVPSMAGVMVSIAETSGSERDALQQGLLSLQDQQAATVDAIQSLQEGLADGLEALGQATGGGLSDNASALRDVLSELRSNNAYLRLSTSRVEL